LEDIHGTLRSIAEFFYGGCWYISGVEVAVLIHFSDLIDQAGAEDGNMSSTLPEALQVYKDELSSARGAIVTGSNRIVALNLEIAKVN